LSKLELVGGHDQVSIDHASCGTYEWVPIGIMWRTFLFAMNTITRTQRYAYGADGSEVEEIFSIP